MRDSASRWFIVKKAEIFWSYVNPLMPGGKRVTFLLPRVLALSTLARMFSSMGRASKCLSYLDNS